MDNEKVWKEKTRLDSNDKYRIIFHIILTILSITVAIIDKDFTWVLVALLWINIIVQEYCDAKMSKGNQVVIDLQEETIDKQFAVINELIDEIYKMKNTKIVDIKEIKIPKKFSKPKSAKMKNRIEYYNTYKRFEVPIIIDEDNNLIDGYTTYLIAKKYNFNNIQVQVKIGGKNNG